MEKESMIGFIFTMLALVIVAGIYVYAVSGDGTA